MKYILFFALTCIIMSCASSDQEEKESVVADKYLEMEEPIEQEEVIEAELEVFIDDTLITDSIVEVDPNEGLSQGGKDYVAYLKQEWKNVANPFIAKYRGNSFGDYHHIDFEDANGKFYDFGDGNNTYGDCELFFDDDHLTDNPKYLNKTMVVYWEWKTSTFPCCEGDYTMTTTKIPSIVNLELKE